MARSQYTFKKRQKEKARDQKRREKEARRLESKQRKESSLANNGDEDPDIAGIIPGPQPLPDEYLGIKPEPEPEPEPVEEEEE